eukprot:CAMPEP_0119563526 /NCGR_PEP_ID=MMETSP1352-20130426/23719_1 /TAXON_ID=265584 /ORGANISM="Stauroneis constricta, Strain CCMP1120" /LENGTH=86 /DNA_ID=CAMNT_0007612143 /DNA_START=927 /DNA_END=1185 /DNA_ORIENTATION=+
MAHSNVESGLSVGGSNGQIVSASFEEADIANVVFVVAAAVPLETPLMDGTNATAGHASSKASRTRFIIAMIVDILVVVVVVVVAIV